MKISAVLFAAALAVSSALAQGPGAGVPSKGVPIKPRLPLVTMAHKPLAFSSGRVLTAADKAQFIASARLAFGAQSHGVSARPETAPASGSPPPAETLTVGQPTASGFALVAEDPDIWDPIHNGLLMNPLGTPQQSFLGLYVEVEPNTIYVLTFQVDSTSASQFVIATAPTGTPVGAQTAETVNVAQGNGGFAYAFDATAPGGIWIWVSAKTTWYFTSVELTPMGM